MVEHARTHRVLPMTKSVWKEEHLATAYRLARAGESEVKIADAMGIHIQTLRKWLKDKPSFKAMIEEGRKARDTERSELSQTTQAHRYVHRRLPAHLADFWNTIKPADSDRSQLHLINLDVASLTEEEQQLVYLHAVIECNYNHSRARMVCGLHLEKINHWVRNCPQMKRWLKEVEESKKDFVEEALMDLVARRETSAVIFAAKTLCRDRGYSDKIQIDVRADDQTAIDELRALTLEQRRLILEALEQKDTPRLAGPVTDAEFEEKPG